MKGLGIISIILLLCSTLTLNGQSLKESIYFNLGMGRSSLINNAHKDESSNFSPSFTWEIGAQRQITDKINITLGANYTLNWIYTRNSIDNFGNGNQVGTQPINFLNTYFRLNDFGIIVLPSVKIKNTERSIHTIGLGYRIGTFITSVTHYVFASDSKGYSAPFKSDAFFNHSFFIDLTYWNKNKNAEFLILNVFRVRVSYNISGIAGNGNLGYLNTGILFGL